MRLLSSLAGALIAFAAATTAFPATAALHARAVYPSKGEPPYSQNLTALKGAIECLNASTLGSAAGGVVLLIHGTGSTGRESWLHGPYTDILPKLSPGYDVCYLTLPYRALRDAQVSAEYVVYAVKSLSLKSATKKVHIIGHSQGGGVNPQWALAFWPSIKKKVQTYVSLSGDFRGTLSNVTDAGVSTNGTRVLSESLYQQFGGSHYMAAQNRAAPAALLTNMTSIYSKYDEVVPASSSKLDGAANFLIQDLCGKLLIVDHFLNIVEFSTFALAYDALLKGRADASRFQRKFCTTYPDGSKKKLDDLVPNLYAIVADLASIIFTNKELLASLYSSPTSARRASPAMRRTAVLLATSLRHLDPIYPYRPAPNWTLHQPLLPFSSSLTHPSRASLPPSRIKSSGLQNIMKYSMGYLSCTTRYRCSCDRAGCAQSV